MVSCDNDVINDLDNVIKREVYPQCVEYLLQKSVVHSKISRSFDMDIWFVGGKKKNRCL